MAVTGDAVPAAVYGACAGDIDSREARCGIPPTGAAVQMNDHGVPITDDDARIVDDGFEVITYGISIAACDVTIGDHGF